MKDSYKSQSGVVIPWLANSAIHGVQISLAKIVQTGSHGEIPMIEFMQAINYSFRTNTCVKINYQGKNQKIAEHFSNFKKFNTDKKFTNPRKMGQVLKNYMLANPGDLDGVYEEFKIWLKESGSQDTTIDTGRSQFERTKDYRKFIELLDKYYSKFGVRDFIQNSSIAGYLVSKGVNVDNGLNEFYGNNSKEFNEIKIDSLNVILEGVAGCGKTYYQNSLFDSQNVNSHLNFYPEQSETVVFHPSTSYEDFVSGLRPQKGGGFTGKAGIFVELCNRAAADSKNNYLLFIDEINRANTAKVFGDLLMVIEESKRTPAEKLGKFKRAVLTRDEAMELGHTTVRLQTAIDQLPEDSVAPKNTGELEYLAVPNNLYIVGTMNSTDRSVGTIDLALRRRFTWHTMEPKTKVEIEEKDKINTEVWVNETLWKWYEATNVNLNEKIGPDARLGHSYFFGENKTLVQVSHDLMKQLAEIAYIFRIPESLITDNIGPTPYHKIEFVGSGLGRRPLVKLNDITNESTTDE